MSPKIPFLRRSIIHGDLNGFNIIVDKNESGDAYHLAGIIDFNDCTKTCTVFDLAVCIAGLMESNLKPLHCSSVIEFVGPIISGYNSVLPLTQDELDSLYYLVLARSLQIVVNGERDFKLEPWNTYILTATQNYRLLIDVLIDISMDQVHKIWRI